jgi:site-specific DNA recombinase
MVKPTKPIAAYTRVSRVGDREERLRSPVLQRQAIERYAKAEGFAVESFPDELDVSGSRAKRPVLDQIIEGVKAGRLGGLVVAKLDRLSRRPPKERVLLFEEIEDAGGVILSAGEQLDPSTPEGRFARDVFLGVARMQWERYREGFERAKESAIADGIPIVNRPAVGYRRAGRKLALDEHAAPVVRESSSVVQPGKARRRSVRS